MSDAKLTETIAEEDVFELLPWYATGKTSPEESRAIERSLAASPKLKAELDLVKQERAVSVESMKAVGEPAPELLDKMLAQLDGTRQLPPLSRDGTRKAAPSILARLFGFGPTPALRLVAIAACLVIVVEGAAIVQLSRPGSTSYETASAPDTTAAGPHLIVQFKPEASLSAINVLLTAADANIVKGPMPDGSFVLALPKTADVDQAIAALKGHADLVAAVDRGS